MIGLDEIEALRHSEYNSDDAVMDMLNTLELLWNHLAHAKEVVAQQVEDEGLWLIRQEGLPRMAEAHLQQELRRLHAVIEEEF